MRRLPLFLLFLLVRPLAAQTVFFPAGDVFRQPLADLGDEFLLLPQPVPPPVRKNLSNEPGVGVVFIY